ncbi:hypothetical protein D3880_11075 [Pseudomonas cavernae]|uniref:Uncharacterized protein n=1 Tax=Pseudomonas cavernae TaxID=2320867 RepID=A0A385Z5W3_9PSED|nr:hypothetical protein D3880_11075 [Pseudomonas cavernae]
MKTASECSFTTRKLRFLSRLTRYARPAGQPSAVTPVGRCALFDSSSRDRKQVLRASPVLNGVRPPPHAA